MASRAKKEGRADIHVFIDRDLLRAFDEACVVDLRSRSNMLEWLIADYMRRRRQAEADGPESHPA